MKVAMAAETERLMRNWARWRSGVPIGLAVSGAYDLEAPGRREETPIPLLNGEAVDVEEGVQALPTELKLVVYVHWLDRDLQEKWIGGKATTDRRARRCRCAVATYYRRLGHAHARIHLHLDHLRDRRRRIALVLGHP